MNRNWSIAACSLAFLASLAFAGELSDRTTLADFESMNAGDVIAPGADSNSKPWRRNGEATSDNITATTNAGDVLSGKVSASYPVEWPHPYAQAMMTSDTPLDLTGNGYGMITIKSSKEDTKSKILFVLSDGKTWYLSKTPQPLTGKSQTLKFPLRATEMELADGPNVDFATVMSTASLVGFKVLSDGSTYTESVIFDDLAVSK